MRTIVVALSCLILIATLQGCAARQATEPTRATPSGTVEMFKMHARYGDRSGEWDILSPGFKRRLSAQAGRTVDVADYVHARDAYRGDPRVRAAEQLLQTAIVVNTEQLSPDRVRASIRTSGGPLAQSGQIGMVRLQVWKLFVSGEPQPYSGYVGDPTFGATRGADGSFVITVDGQAVQTIPAAQVTDYKVEALWYVDDLGGLEQQFMQS